MMGIVMTVLNDDIEGIELLALMKLGTVAVSAPPFSVTGILFCILLLITFAYTVFFFVIKPKLSPLSKIPGPSTSAYQVLKIIRRDDTYKFAQEVAAEYGPVARISWPGKHIVFVSGVEEIDCILHKYNKSYETSPQQLSVFKKLLTGGLLASTRLEHDQLKKVLSPAFNINKIRELVPKMNEHATQLVENWVKKIDNSVGGKEIQVQQEITNTAIVTVMDCAFGYKKDCLIENEDGRFMHVILKQCLPFHYRNLIPFYKYLPLESNRKADAAENKAKELINSVIERRRNNSNRACEEKDLLENIMQIQDKETGQSFSDEDLYGNILTFLAAGYETTSLALAWTMLSLAKNPEVQVKLRNEIRSVCPGYEEIGWKDLEKMPYLSSVMQESLRKNSPTPFLTRVSEKEQVIGGYTIPAGTDIFIWTGIVQNSPQYWDSPEEFRPERFMEKKPVAGSFLPFGSGRCQCIGNRLATMTSKIILGMLIRNFSFEALPDVKYDAKLRVTLSPFPYIKLKVQRVD